MVMSMNFAKVNKEVIIRSLKGSQRSKSKLLERGFCIGEKLSIIRDDNSNFIVELNNTRYVLNLSLANKILVEEI